MTATLARRPHALIVLTRAAFDPSKHKRVSKGSPGGGRFMKMVDQIAAAIHEHRNSGGEGHGWASGFNREQLRRVAKERGIELKRGESQDSIAQKLMDHLDEKVSGHEPTGVEKAPDVPAKKPRTPRKKAAPSAPAPTPEPAAPPAEDRSPAAHAALDERIGKLRAQLDALHEEAAPIADALAKHMQGHGITSSHHLQDELKRIGLESDPVAAELLDALIERHGQPWGGDPTTDAERWVRPRADLATVMREGRAHPGLGRTRDKYVVDDRNTIKQNVSLRSGTPTPAAKRWAAQMSEMVQASEVPTDSLFFRGAAMRPEDVVGLHPGAELVDHGIISTDLKPDQADFYADTRFDRLPGTIKTLYEIRVPKGSAVADVGFGEMVLDHGSRFRVVSSHITRGPVGVFPFTHKGEQRFAYTRPDSAGVVHVVLELIDDSAGAVKAMSSIRPVALAEAPEDPDPAVAVRRAWAPGEVTIVPSDEPDTEEHGPLDESSAALLVALHRVEDELAGGAAKNLARLPYAHFDPLEKRDDHGKWSKIGALVDALKKAGHGGGVQLGDDKYADWSVTLPHGGRRFEVGEGNDAVNLDLSRAEIDELHDDMTASLAEKRSGGFMFGDGDHDHRELSWDPVDDEGDEWQLHAIDKHGEETSLDLTYAQMEHLHHGLTTQQLLDAHDAPASGGTHFRELTPDQALEMQDQMGSWTPEQSEALYKYSANAYRRVNAALRGNRERYGDPSPETLAQIEHIRAALKPIPEDIVVRREVGADTFGLTGTGLAAEGSTFMQQAEQLIGRTWHDPGFTSTTVGNRGLATVLMSISVPKGTRGAYIEPVTHNDGEHEILLDRGTHFRIDRAEPTERGLILHMTVVGQDD